MRALLVGSGVSLGTPLFATAGVALVWQRVLPRQLPGLRPILTWAMGGGLATLMYQYVGPFLLQHSEVVLPFAAANAVTATFWYVALENLVGLEYMAGRADQTSKSFLTGSSVLPKALRSLPLPVGGMLVGGLTALTAGYLYPVMANFLWPTELQVIMSGDDSKDFAWMVDLHHRLLLPVSLPVGVLAGVGVHGMLAPFLLGSVAGGAYPWTATCLPVLAFLTGGSVYYFTQKGCYDASSMFWEKRLNRQTGEPVSYNILTRESRDGFQRANSALLDAYGAQAFSILRSPMKKMLVFFLPRWFDDEQKLAGQVGNTSAKLPASDREITLRQLGDHEQLNLFVDAIIHLKYQKMRSSGARPGSQSEKSKAPGALQPTTFQSGVDEPVDSGSVPVTAPMRSSNLFEAEEEDELSSRDLGGSDLSRAATRRLNHYFDVDMIKVLESVEVLLLTDAKAREARRMGNAAAFARLVKEYDRLKDDLLDATRFSLPSEDGSAANPQEGALRLLAANMPTLRRRFKEELNYDALVDNEASASLQKRKAETFWHAVNRAAVVTVPAAVLATLAIALRKSS